MIVLIRKFSGSELVLFGITLAGSFFNRGQQPRLKIRLIYSLLERRKKCSHHEIFSNIDSSLIRKIVGMRMEGYNDFFKAKVFNYKLFSDE